MTKSEVETSVAASSPEKEQQHVTEQPVATSLPPALESTTPEERKEMERRLVRKLDLRLMCPLILMYILNYLDRNAIGAAKVAGIVPSLGLTDSQFQLSVSILFIGYVLMQVPSNLFLNKIGRPSIYLPACMAAWGVLCAATGATQSFSGLAATRFLLGFTEAAYFPGCMLCLTVWYTRKELALRTALLYCGSLLSGAFSGLLTAGITSSLDGVRGLESWRWLFIVEGSATVFIALITPFILPDFPSNTRWLSDQECALAIFRQSIDTGDEESSNTTTTTTTATASKPSSNTLDGFIQCITDYKVWTLILMIFGIHSSGTINAYFPTIVRTIGYGKTVTLLLTAPPYLLSCIVALLVALNSDRTAERYLHFTIPATLSVLGFIISMVTLNTAARYFSMMIMLPGVYTAFIIGTTWMANCLPKPGAKRATALAMAGTFSNCSSVYGPFLYPDATAPRYLLAMGFNAGTAVVSVAVATYLRVHLRKLNKKMNVAEFGTAETARSNEERGEAAGALPVSKSFRYIY
ncbi:major facilitator superfamily protein [Sarocladium implicatum]|nr:major facilitator superfamily protein [Sarocladium implicatum]